MKERKYTWMEFKYRFLTRNKTEEEKMLDLTPEEFGKYLAGIFVAPLAAIIRDILDQKDMQNEDK